MCYRRGRLLHAPSLMLRFSDKKERKKGHVCGEGCKHASPCKAVEVQGKYNFSNFHKDQPSAL